MSQPHAQAGLRAGLAQGARGRRPGHNHFQKFRVWTSGQMRRVTAAVRREMRRRAVVEPVIGHIKAEHRMSRSYLKGRDGARINAVLAGLQLLLLRWLERLWRALIRALLVLCGGPNQPGVTCFIAGDGTPLCGDEVV